MFRVVGVDTYLDYDSFDFVYILVRSRKPRKFYQEFSGLGRFQGLWTSSKSESNSRRSNNLKICEIIEILWPIE